MSLGPTFICKLNKEFPKESLLVRLVYIIIGDISIYQVGGLDRN